MNENEHEYAALLNGEFEVVFYVICSLDQYFYECEISMIYCPEDWRICLRE